MKNKKIPPPVEAISFEEFIDFITDGRGEQIKSDLGLIKPEKKQSK